MKSGGTEKFGSFRGKEMAVIEIIEVWMQNRPFYRVIAANRMDGGKRMGINFDRIKACAYTPSSAPYYIIIAADFHISTAVSSSVSSCRDGVLVICWCSAFGPCSTYSFQSWSLTSSTNACNGHKGGPRDIRPVDPLTGRVIFRKKNIQKTKVSEDGENNSEE
ncbi:hypothetical protein GIB67_034707 [Kingdonia uniflora]|uniref:Uncharacterized protein n=1 Tax=Kingdonia uniflora TaxID=39325 RepID=A0A7J7MLB2_9MAGN|nr:hypothetical protein GIB67_034707 [Kingdonia uniflora]